MNYLIKKLDEYIEYASSTKRFADVGFYEEIKIELNGLQAEIDRLMLEYCPNEMTEEQIKEWEKHQKPVK